MSKFNTATISRPKRTVNTPLATSVKPSGTTHEGGTGYSRDPKSELFLLVVTELAGEDTFYEKSDDRATRLRLLVKQIAPVDPGWIVDLVYWVRHEGNLRSVAVQLACEAVKARLDVGAYGNNRTIISASQLRGDEPGEVLGYWISRFGRNIPQPVKNGVGDGAKRLYRPRAVIKYDSRLRGFGFADVLALAHPKPSPFTESEELFKYLSVKKRHPEEARPSGHLPILAANRKVMEIPKSERRQWLLDAGPSRIIGSGLTWEQVSGWLGGPMDKEVWKALIPTMGYMALLRNLRNFDQAGIGEDSIEYVQRKLRDPEEVAKSRQLPLRFLSAYRNSHLRWHYTIEQALTLSVQNVPSLDGRTLILVDRSGSMFQRMSAKSDLNRSDAAAVFGAAFALRAKNALLVEFGSDSHVVTHSGKSILQIANSMHDLGGTETTTAVQRHLNGHDRVIILTDEQAFYHWWGDPGTVVPANVPMHTVNLAGYRKGHAAGGPNRYVYGGLTDATFSTIPLVEAGHDGCWPWEQ